jgi:predicted Zn finger-like uncharacterized protein
MSGDQTPPRSRPAAPMAEEQYTRCPSCRTVFRVTPSQLEMRAGQVRCGHCRTVFDGVLQQVALAPRAETDDDIDAYDEAALGPPTVTLRSAQALLPASSDATPAARLDADAPAPRTTAEAGDDGMPVPRSRDRRSYVRAAMAVAVPLLIVLLAGQAAFHSRETLAARWPALNPVMARMCAAFGCAVGAPREIADLAIQSSDLQADPAHQGLLILTATLRNHAGMARAYPYLELSLTDAQDQIVVRRALAPGEYAGGTADLSAGIPANGEVAIKLFIDASATAQAGYRLYLFYG